jgi:hypothetical protein
LRFNACDDNVAAGITLDITESGKLSNTMIYYLSKSFFPEAGATETGSNGLAGIFNLKVGKVINFVVKLGSVELPTFTLTARAGRSIYVDYFPYGGKSE